MEETKKQYHFLYKTTNKFNNKFYIGVHSTFNLNDRYLGSGYRLNKDIERFGKSQYEREILEFFDTREKAYKREKEVVNETLMKNWYCLNVAEGGSNYKKGNKLHFKSFTDCDWDKITWHNLMKDDKTHRVITELFDYFISIGWCEDFRVHQLEIPQHVHIEDLPEEDEEKEEIDNRIPIIVKKITYEQNDEFDGLFIHYHLANVTIKENKIFKVEKYFKENFNSYWFKIINVEEKFNVINKNKYSDMFVNLIIELTPMLKLI